MIVSIENLIEEKFWDPEDLIRYRLLCFLDRREIERIDSYDIINTNEKEKRKTKFKNREWDIK